MNNETTANKAGVGAMLGLLVLWGLRAVVPPDIREANPLPEEAIMGLVTWAVCYFVPARVGESVSKAAGTWPVVVLGLFLAGCSGSALSKWDAVQLTYEATAGNALDYAEMPGTDEDVAAGIRDAVARSAGLVVAASCAVEGYHRPELGASPTCPDRRPGSTDRSTAEALTAAALPVALAVTDELVAYLAAEEAEDGSTEVQP